MLRSRLDLQWVLLLAMLLAQAPSLAQSVVRVHTEGVAAVVADVGLARDEAIRDALRNALEQALGAVVEARTLMVDFQVLEDRVSSRTSGFVRSYQVISDERDGDLYRITIEAEIDADLLVDDLEGFGALLRTVLGNPRVLVVIDGGSSRDGRGDALHHIVVDFLVERNFQVIDALQAALTAASRPLDYVTYARSVEADIIIVVRPQTAVHDVTVGKRTSLQSARSSVRLEGVLASTGQIIATGEGERTLVGVQGDSTSAEAEALHEGLEGFVLALVGHLNSTVTAEGALASLRIVVSTIPDYEALASLQGQLEGLRGVASVYLRRFDAGTATFDLQGDVTADMIAARLSSLTHPGVRIDYLDTHRLEGEFRP